MIKSLVLALSIFVAIPLVAQRYCPNAERNERALQEFKRHTGFTYGRPGYAAVTQRSNCNCGIVRRNDFVWIRMFEAVRLERERNRECHFRVEDKRNDNAGHWWDSSTVKKKRKNKENDKWWSGEIYRRPQVFGELPGV